jgi:DNA-binding beta-propeller fold protein YncE
MVTDLAGSQILLADAANRCLWLWNGTNWQPRSAQDPALGQPTALAADPALSLVWVADADFQCLRKWVSSQGAAAYAASELETTSGGAWLRRRFRPPASLGLGSPLGLAMDPHGNRVYLHDRGRLLAFSEAPNRWELLGVFPNRLIEQGPSGLACDRFGEHLFVATEQGALWKVPARPGLTNGEFQQLWP